MERGAPERSLLEEALGPLSPDTPVVVAGPIGSGRTALLLGLADAATRRGERVVLLASESPRHVLRRADALGLRLERALRDERFVLLEAAPDIAGLVRARGAGRLVASLRAAAPGARWLLVDPITALAGELVDEPSLRRLARDVLHGAAERDQIAVVSAEREVLAATPLEPVLATACGAWVELEPGRLGDLSLAVRKSARPATGTLRFRIGPDGLRRLHGDPARATAAAGAARPRRVLVVEPDDATRERMAGWLAGRHEVATARDGIEAVTQAIAFAPELVTLELALPRVGGFEVLRALRSGDVARVPVLVVSGRLARAADRVRALVLGATDLLPKPTSRVELLRKLELLSEIAPAAARAALDAREAEALLGGERGRRVMAGAAFRAHVDAAARFGARFDLGSSLVAVEAAENEVLDRAVGAAERTLRAEDALLVATKRRALLLLVCCAPDEVEGVLRRLAPELAPGPEAGLRWRAHPARRPAPGGGWDELFADLAPWPR